MRRLLILLALVALMAAACGGDDSSAEGDDTGGDDTAASAEDDTGGDDTASGGDDTGGDDTASGGDDTAAATGGGEGSDFCDRWTSEEEDLGPDTFDFFATPDELEATVTESLEAFDEVRDSAPDEIRADVDVLYDNFSELAQLLEDNDWNYLAIAEDAPTLDGQAAIEASANIDAYCGVADGDAGVDVDPSDFLPDPDVIEDLQQDGSNDPEGAALTFYQALGHDEATAQCLVEEFGDFEQLDSDPSPELFTEEYCGLTILEILNPNGFG